MTTMGAQVRAWLWRALKAYGVFAVLQTLAKTIRFVRQLRRFDRMTAKLPGVRMGPSELQQVMRKDIHRLQDLRLEWMAPFDDGKTHLSVLPGNDVAALSPEAVKFMLKDEFSRITKVDEAGDYTILMLADFIGAHGIFILRHGEAPNLAAQHAEWVTQRKTASKLFTKNEMTGFMTDVFTKKADLLLASLSKIADNQGRVDMQQKFFSYTFDAIQELFYAREIDTVSGDKMDPYAQAFDVAHASMIQYVMQNIFNIVLLQEVAPWPIGAWGRDARTSWGLKLLRKLSPEGQLFEKNVAFLHKETQRFVQETRSDPNLAKREDLLARFINAPGGDKLSDEQLRHIVLNFILAGRDTTACTLTWLFYELAVNPHVQKELQAEIDRVLGGRDATLDDLESHKMPYLNGCIYETLRLHPPVPADTKQVTEDMEFQGTTLPKGTVLVFFPYGMGRNATRYPDPLSFKPERWIPFTQPSDFEMPVFQAGPRFCLGRHMAQFEAKLLTSKLLQRFDFALQEGEKEKITYSLMITMSLKNGPGKDDTQLWMLPTHRKR